MIFRVRLLGSRLLDSKGCELKRGGGLGLRFRGMRLARMLGAREVEDARRLILC